MSSKKDTVRYNSDHQTVDVYVVNVGKHRRDPEAACGPFANTSHILHYVVAGKGMLVCLGKAYELNPGDVFLLPRGVETEYWADKDDPYEYYWVTFDGTYANELLQNLGLTAESPVRRVDDQKIAADFAKFYTLFCKYRAHNNVAGLSLFYNIFERLMILLLPADYRETDNYPIIDSMIDYIDKNYMTDINFGELCDKFKIARSYFSQLFKQKKGTPPRVYLLNLRLTAAARLLENRSLSIAEIAAAVDMKRVQFVRMFTRKFDFSPTQFRKHLGKPNVRAY